MLPIANSVVSETTHTLQDVIAPPALMVRIDQHRQNLVELAVAMLEGGQDVDEVRQTIAMVTSSFQEELARTILSLRESNNAV